MEKIPEKKNIQTILQSYAPVITACAAIISAITAFYSVNIAYKMYNLKTPAYAIINKNGDILERQNFGKFGISVKKEKAHPIYKIIFDNTPDYFEISTQESAVREIKQIGPKEYEVKFVIAPKSFDEVGGTMECDFKVQAYDYK